MIKRSLTWHASAISSMKFNIISLILAIQGLPVAQVHDMWSCYLEEQRQNLPMRLLPVCLLFVCFDRTLWCRIRKTKLTKLLFSTHLPVDSRVFATNPLEKYGYHTTSFFFINCPPCLERRRVRNRADF